MSNYIKMKLSGEEFKSEYKDCICLTKNNELYRLVKTFEDKDGKYSHDENYVINNIFDKLINEYDVKLCDKYNSPMWFYGLKDTFKEISGNTFYYIPYDEIHSCINSSNHITSGLLNDDELLKKYNIISYNDFLINSYSIDFIYIY